jgi:hypothetical protein
MEKLPKYRRVDVPGNKRGLRAEDTVPSKENKENDTHGFQVFLSNIYQHSRFGWH